MLWYLTHLFHIGIEFFIPDLQHFLTNSINNEEAPEMTNLAKFLKWFYPLEHWANMIMFESFKNTRVQYVVIIFYKPQYLMQNGPATQLASLPSAWIHRTYFDEVYENPFDVNDFQKYLCQLNRFIPSEIWPSGNSQAPWDVQKDPPTPYQQQLEDALMEYQSNIPDPKEWSQEYPMFCSQAVQDTPAWKDMQEDNSRWKDIQESSQIDPPQQTDTSDVIPPDDLERRVEQMYLRCYRAREKKRIKIEELNITSDIDTDYDDESLE
uniref:Uncharacterized protein n=1 Tax=Gossypium raimondii TaxID=29730 RepID=A0A0D2VBU9_GOSRA|nr:hypothetical protein B456_013G072000 [Gossypium raimondii]